MPMPLFIRVLQKIILSAALIAFAGTAHATPESGWWWNPAEGGRGFTIEVQNGQMFMAGYMYDDTGRATWYASGPTKMVSDTMYQGQWQQYGGGQTLSGAYKSANTANANAGYVSITFSSPTTATMVMPNGVTIPLVRYTFGGAPVGGGNTSGPANVCDSSNFTSAKFSTIAVGMTLPQVKQAIGCKNSSEQTVRIGQYVGYAWTARIPGSLALSYFIWVYFDSTGTVVTDMYAGAPGTTPYFKNAIGF